MRRFFLLADQRARSLKGVRSQRARKRPSTLSPIGWPMTPEPLEDASFGHDQPLAEAIPNHCANTANDQVTATPKCGIDTPSFGQVPSSTSPSKECACIACLRVGIIDINNRGPYRCHFASCDWIPPIATLGERYGTYETYSIWDHHWAEKDRSAHVRTHYQRGPNYLGTPFSCPVQNCRFSSKRWSALLYRHTTAKHCKNPPKFACSVIGCKYNGEGNGFIRKDKLTDHYKNMHQGQKVHGQTVRAIKPAPAPALPLSHAEGSGSSSIGA